MRALRWPVMLVLCAVMLPVAALAQPVKLLGDDDPDKPQFVELDAKPPPMPKAENLLRFEGSAANTNSFFIDAGSIQIAEDGVVRYTMVIKSPSGAENISYEGIRCETTEQKTYAYGRRDGTWSIARAPAWKKIQYREFTGQHGILYAYYFCPDGAPIRSAQDAIQRFKYGVPYGQPPRSSNGRY